MKRFHLAAELRRTNVAGIADLTPLTDISYDEFDAETESDDSSDLGRAKGKAPISLKQSEFSLKQFATRMGQPNLSLFNRWKKVWVAGFLEKHQSNIPGQNRLKQMCDGPLHWEMGVGHFLETIETWMPFEDFDNAEWILRQWVEMFLKKCRSEVRQAKKNGWRGNTNQ
jgi:hypothetical protein